ncbi:hypothetical protein DER45DRAFT_537466 [Fusarium avenaceum]|nr:hypothetical protein DER45DRAFT_537466 [Fusarium avenaceum]
MAYRQGIEYQKHNESFSRGVKCFTRNSKGMCVSSLLEKFLYERKSMSVVKVPIGDIDPRIPGILGLEALHNPNHSPGHLPIRQVQFNPGNNSTHIQHSDPHRGSSKFQNRRLLAPRSSNQRNWWTAMPLHGFAPKNNSPDTNAPSTIPMRRRIFKAESRFVGRKYQRLFVSRMIGTDKQGDPQYNVVLIILDDCRVSDSNQSAEPASLVVVSKFNVVDGGRAQCRMTLMSGPKSHKPPKPRVPTDARNRQQ